MIGRVAVFLALFGGGLAVLVEVFDVELPTHWGAPQSTLPRRDKAGAVVSGEEFGTMFLLVNGATEYNRYVQVGGRGVPRYRLVAEDSETGPEGEVVLRDLVLELYDAETGEQSLELRAAVGRTRLVEAGDSAQPTLSDHISFEDVTVELLRGTRLVPLTLESDTLEADLEAQTFTTPSRAVVRGSGLDAEGSALDLALATGRVVFASDARCTVAAGEGGRGRLVSSGPLEIERVGPEEDARLRVVAERRALLAVEGDGELSLQARRIELVGRSADDDGSADGGSTDGAAPAEALVFESLAAEGEVTLHTAGHRFEGQRVTFELTDEGTLGSARLIGGPVAHLALTPPAVAGGEAAAPEALRVWGESTMDLDWSPGVAVTVAGPAQLDWRDTELWAAGGLSGRPATEDEPASFRAWAGVEVRFANWVLATPELDGELEDDRLRVRTLGESDLRGTTRAGEDLHLVAYEQLTFVAEGDRWSVPDAGRFALTLASDPPVSATADRLLDLDPETLSYTAEGNVEVVARDDLLRGGRVIARGRDDLTVESLGQDRVFFVSPRGEVQAHRLVRRPGRLLAEGDVEAQLELETLTGDVRARRVQLLGAFGADTTPDTLGRTELTAVGDVVAELREGDDVYDLAGDDLWLLREPLLDSDAALTELRVVGSVDLTTAGAYGHYRLRSDRLEGLLFNRGRAALPDVVDGDAEGELMAEGNVRLESLRGRAFDATGGRLVLRQGGSGTLEPAPDGVVTAAGLLPSTARPFTLVAQWLRFAPEELIARRPQLSLGIPAGAVDPTPLDGLQATAVELVARTGLVSFAGDVSFVGRMPSGSTWSLRARAAEFEGAPDDANADRQRLVGMVAEGDVRLAFSDGPTAEGDRLSARTWSGMIRLDGSPARIRHSEGGGLSAEFIKLDPREYLIEAGPGRIDLSQRGPAPQDRPR